MERLHQVKALCVACGYCLFAVCAMLGQDNAMSGRDNAMSAQDRCSLVIRVLAPDGLRPEVTITVRERNGRTEQKDQEDKDVRFCDLGILPVEVKVGSDGMCNAVTVRNVPVSLDDTFLLNVTYDPVPCMEKPAPPLVPILPGPVPRVGFGWQVVARRIAIRLSGHSDLLKTDRYGRASYVAKLGDEVRGSASREGGPAKDFDFKCTRGEPLHEEYLRLGP